MILVPIGTALLAALLGLGTSMYEDKNKKQVIGATIAWGVAGFILGVFILLGPMDYKLPI